MKRIFQTTYLLGIVLFSCSQLKVSEKETEGLSEIASLYGGNISYSIRLNASTSKGNTRVFEIEIENSDVIIQNQRLVEMFASNIAFLFFKSSQKQKEKYDSILTTIHFQEGGKATFAYNREVLQIVDSKLKNVYQTVEILKAKNYDQLSNTIKTGPVLLEENRIKYIDKLKSMDSTFGDIYDFTMSGFRMSPGNNEKYILHISGSLKRSKKDTQFGIDISAESGKYEFYYIEYYY